MKKYFKSGCLAAVIAIMLSGCAAGNYSTLSTVSATVTFQSFYDDLSPYGIWMDYPGYGQVWHPRPEGDFRPYATNGYWIYSYEGWTWVSNYNWGWAPFHYGRWVYDDFYGWLWVPGYEWSPAWVTWGYVDDYYAWAPLMPEVNVSIYFNSWKPNNFYWNLCHRNQIYERNLYNKIERPERVNDFNNRVNVMNNFNTTRTNNQVYSRGPDVAEVEKSVNRKIEPVTLKTVRKVPAVTVPANEKNVFRPAIPQAPKPREYKRVENEKVSPIRSNEQKPSLPKVEQNRNIEKLPVFKNTPQQTPNVPAKKTAVQQQKSPAAKMQQ
ncbi:MAG: hypothetical protein IPL50_04785 [Chitinophagaceae bacterium]|nr:hypothetical protein [Chitinophagaceae bacterium]